MINAKETAIIWKEVQNVFDDTWHLTPKDTIDELLKKYDLQQLKETFAAVTKFKKYDGRIYGRNRSEMEKIPTDPLCEVFSHENPLLGTGLDNIHTTHINQMITELLRRA